MGGRVLIVASGLRGVTGHNLAYTRTVEEALCRRGYAVTVFANKALDREIANAGYRPVFSLGTYDVIPGNGPWADLMYLYAQSVVYAFDLQRALSDSPAFDLVFCHTVSSFEVIAWNRVLRRHRMPGHLALLLRNTPGFRGRPCWKLRWHPYWRILPRYLNAIRRKLGARFHLLTDSDRLTADYTAVYRHPIRTTPIPLSIGEDDRGNGHHAGPTIHVGYMGDSREAKGFSLLPGVIRNFLATPGPVSFVIQCASNEYDRLAPPPALRELTELESVSHGRLRLVRTPLSEDEYRALYRSLDVVLLPYTHGLFREGTSNVFAEALALGKPVIVPEDTWMAAELRHCGAGLEFCPAVPGDLATKLGHLVTRYDDFAARARAGSGAWRQRHAPDAVADVLLRESGLP